MLRSRHAGLTGSLRVSCTLHTSPFHSPWTRRTSWSIRACSQSGEASNNIPAVSMAHRWFAIAAMDEMIMTLGSADLRRRGTSPAVRKYTPLTLTAVRRLVEPGGLVPAASQAHATRRHGGQYRLHGTAPSHAPRLVTSQSSLPLARTTLEAKRATHSSTPSHTSVSTASASIRFVSRKQRQRRTVQVICDRVPPRLLYRRIVDHNVDLHSARALDRRMIACPGTSSKWTEIMFI